MRNNINKKSKLGVWAPSTGTAGKFLPPLLVSPPPPISLSLSPSPLPLNEQRARRRKACDLCTSRKIRCNGGLPSCGPCKARQVECRYSTRQRSGPKVSCRAAQCSWQPHLVEVLCSFWVECSRVCGAGRSGEERYSGQELALEEKGATHVVYGVVGGIP